MDKQFLNEWSRLKAEHTAHRDGANNYACFNVELCRGCTFLDSSRNCVNCHDSSGLIECLSCVGCRDCAYSVGLSHARFHILNEEYSETDYYQRLTELGVDWNVDALTGPQQETER